MVTYLARMPALIPSENGKAREVKIDFLLEDINLPVQVVRDVETFALKVKELKCYSATSLVGDKILTLAENTVGIAVAADLPKQIYDVSSLIEKLTFSVGEFLEVLCAVEKLVPIEAGYRGLNITVTSALSDIETTMEKYGLLDTSDANSAIKRNVANFQQFYVSSSQKWSWYEWCTRALKISFLSRLLRAVIEKKVEAKKACDEYCSAVKIAQLLSTFKGEKVKMLNKELMASADAKITCFKELKGKPLRRVFWQVVSLNNLKKIRDTIETQT